MEKRLLNKWNGKIAKVLFFFMTLLAGAVSFAQELPTKVVIFYSSIGMGHLSAARAIEQSIKAQDPKATVILKNVKDFEPKRKQEVETWIYWYLVKNYPDIFDKMFRSTMEQGNKIPRISDLKGAYGYDHDAILSFINDINPTSIIATHYGSAQVLGNLRERGHLRNKPIAWLHTDYFKGYFPRISKRIDQTYVGMTQVRDMWIEEGVDPTRVAATGIPVNPSVFTPIDREEFMKSKNLDPKVTTIVIATGGEGVGDFEAIVESITAKIPGKIQIIAACAKSEENFAKLEKLKGRIRTDVSLQVHKMVPNADLLNFIKASDVYITKSGGLSPTEGFAITKPMVLLDIYGGHERDNAQLFEKEGLALVNRNQGKIGDDVQRLMADAGLRERMIKAQMGFRNTINLNAIGEFAVKTRSSNVMSNFHLGVEGGQEVKLTEEALAKLEKDSPADVEIILSYGKSFDGKYYKKGNESNPFGHLAVRVGNKVYTANGRAVHGTEDNQIHQTTLKEYLYGVNRPYQNVEHTDAFGSSYGRDNISFRVQNVSQDRLAAMAAEVAKIDEEFRKGETHWHKTEDNCADMTIRILRAGGFDFPELKVFDNPKRVTLPSDVYDAFKGYFEERKEYRTEIVLYSQVRDAQNIYKSTRYPLSFYKMKDLAARLLLNRAAKNELEAGKRISFYSGDQRAYYENVNGNSIAKSKEQAEQAAKQQAESLDQIVNLETQIDAAKAAMEKSEQTTDALNKRITDGMKSFSTEEAALIRAGKTSEIKDAAKRARAEALMREIANWDRAQAEYQKLNDRMAQMELDYFIDGTRQVMTETYQQLVSGRTTAEAKKLKGLFDKANSKYEIYKNNRDQYGKPKDGPTRTASYREFFANAKAYMDILNGSSMGKSAEAQTYWAKLKAKTARLYHVVRVISRLAPRAVATLVNVMLRPVTGPGEAPVTQSIYSLIKEMRDQMGVKVQIEGRERLPQPKALGADKVVNIVAPTHRDPLLDAFVMTELGTEKAFLVMAPDQFAPKKLADRVAGVDTIVAVGRGSDTPVNKLLEQLKTGKSDTILIYPEGSVSAGLNETRPVREKFNWGLVQRLMQEGYKVNLIPVTYKDTARFTYESTIDLFAKIEGKETLNAEVHQKIDHQTLELLMAAGGSEAVGRYLRAAWMEGLGSDAKTLHGLLRPQAVSDLLRKQIGVNVNVRQCRDIFMFKASGF